MVSARLQYNFSIFASVIKTNITMRLKRHILLVLLFVGISLNAINAQVYTTRSLDNVTTTTHTVRMGETAYGIATAYKTTVEEIYRLNPGSESKINVGQELRVPSAAAVLQSQTQNTKYDNTISHKHIILAKETLFSVSQKYNITVSELRNANPGLDESSFSIGREINIPNYTNASPKATSSPLLQKAEITFSDYEHKVEKQETLYSISKKYNCTTEDILIANPSIRELGLQEGSIIFVPKKSTTSFQSRGELNTNNATYFLPQDGVVRIALLLPFIEGSNSLSKTASIERITEYYEGFLLAVQRMKEKGLNAEIYTFDIGSDNDTRRLESILGTTELNSLNLIIGGVSERQVQLISKFSQNTGIKYVVPFSNKNTGVNNNKNMFQVANSHSNLFPKIVRGFANTFADANIIFLTEAGSDKNKLDFVKELQKDLRDANIASRTAPSTASITDDLNAVIDKNKRNIIVPTSSSEATMKRIMDAMPILTKNETNISLFGYPEWQAYLNKTKKLHQFNSYMYSTFYLDTAHPESQLFADRYKKWYNKNFIVAMPRYAHMGYDTGIVFLTALQRLGHDFSSRIGDLNTPTLQSALYFEPASAKGGYINTGVYFINLRPDGSVVKTEISKQ